MQERAETKSVVPQDVQVWEERGRMTKVGNDETGVCLLMESNPHLQSHVAWAKKGPVHIVDGLRRKECLKYPRDDRKTRTSRYLARTVVRGVGLPHPKKSFEHPEWFVGAMEKR